MLVSMRLEPDCDPSTSGGAARLAVVRSLDRRMLRCMRTAAPLLLACLVVAGTARAEPTASAGPRAEWLREVSAFCSIAPRAPGDRGESVVTLIATVEDDVELTRATVGKKQFPVDPANDANLPPRYVFRIQVRGLCAKSELEATVSGTSKETGQAVSATRRVTIGKVN
jgi:hypothetical protein